MTNKHFLLTEVAVVAPGSLLLTFADGQQFTVALDEIILKHASLAPLADPKVFATAAMGEWKDTVIWAGDDNLELAADNLRARALEQAGECSHELIWNWMAKHGLTLDRAAQELGLSRRMLAYYRSGEKPVPRTVALAMKGWEALRMADEASAAAGHASKKRTSCFERTTGIKKAAH
ncbi:hypothetical protein PPUJ20028_30380 [Pseudomonas putida]|uniref:DUF2442 domain-containing protein n=1 Tax=Pseudomonas putida TaxID=303 RepID=A0AA37RHY0_PSEPU|nr:DUF2442 domain-containing protein [Pseudomonas putida]GLO14455.1 hypothetical protein PPUJ20028_30380 [Pseudomonas putida]GLO36939.1 hypothetical protein PPUN14671_37750 [Pseudomonas putida]